MAQFLILSKIHDSLYFHFSLLSISFLSIVRFHLGEFCKGMGGAIPIYAWYQMFFFLYIEAAHCTLTCPVIWSSYMCCAGLYCAVPCRIVLFWRPVSAQYLLFDSNLSLHWISTQGMYVLLFFFLLLLIQRVNPPLLITLRKFSHLLRSSREWHCSAWYLLQSELFMYDDSVFKQATMFFHSFSWKVYIKLVQSRDFCRHDCFACPSQCYAAILDMSGEMWSR